MANAGCINAIGFDGCFLQTLQQLDSACIGVGVQYTAPNPLDDKRLDYIKYTDKNGNTCCLTGENEILIYATNGTIKNLTLTNDDANEVVNVKRSDVFGSNRKKTVVRYKTGSYPTSITDGTLAVEELVQNQYQSSGYNVSGLSDATTYYFTAFAVAQDDTIIVVQTNSITPEFRPPKNGLLAYYTFNNSLNDSLGNYSLTQQSSPTYATGLKGNAIKSGGGYVNIPIGTTFTIRFFYKGTSSNTGVISIYTSSSRQYQGRIDILRLDNGIGKVYGRNNNGTTYAGASVSTSVFDNQRHHVVITKNGTSVQAFVDSVKTTGNFPMSGQTYLTVKSKDRQTISEAIVDDMLVYNRVRTDAEVSKDYQKFQQLIG